MLLKNTLAEALRELLVLNWSCPVVPPAVAAPPESSARHITVPCPSVDRVPPLDNPLQSRSVNVIGLLIFVPPTTRRPPARISNPPPVNVEVADPEVLKESASPIPLIASAVPGVEVPTPTFPDASITNFVVSLAASSTTKESPVPKFWIMATVFTPTDVVAIANPPPGVVVPIPIPPPLMYTPPPETLCPPMERRERGVVVPTPRNPEEK